MRALLFTLLLATLSFAQTDAACECVDKWEFKGEMYSKCDPATPKDKEPWCYVDGDGCPEAQESTVKSGEFWRYCQPSENGPDNGAQTSPQANSAFLNAEQSDDTPAMADEPSTPDNQGVDAPEGTHVVQIVSNGEDLNPNEAGGDNGGAPAPAPAATDSAAPMHPLKKTMSEGRLLRKLWAEMNEIESMIHDANVDLKARLLKAFKVIRERMAEWENSKDKMAQATQGQKLRAQWEAMGAIEDEIHEINQAMKTRLQGLIKSLRSKMHIFDAAATKIDAMRAAAGKPPGVKSANAADAAKANPNAAGAGAGEQNINNPCSPGEVAIAGADGAVGCSVDPSTENQVAYNYQVAVPSYRRHLEPIDQPLTTDQMVGAMGPLVKTVSEGSKLRALWSQLGAIEKEIHETNLALKDRLEKAFKVIRARMVEWEKEGDADKKKSEGQKLRAQWAQLGKVEEEIHATNQEMKRRLRRVIRVIKENMEHFDKGAKEAKQLGKEQKKQEDASKAQDKAIKDAHAAQPDPLPATPAGSGENTPGAATKPHGIAALENDQEAPGQ